MTYELFEKILYDAQAIQPECIFPFLNGEPFLDNDLVKKLKMINHILPQTQIQIFTNAHLMTPDKIRSLQEVDKIHSMNISLNVCDDTKRMNIMGIPWEQTRSNLEYLRKVFPSLLVSASLIYDICLINHQDITIYQNECSLLGIKHNIFPSGNWAGKIRKCYANYDRCTRPFCGMSILADGRAVLCCFDSDGEVVLGDLNKQSMKDIWESEAYGRIRDLHNQGKRAELPLCNNCTTI